MNLKQKIIKTALALVCIYPAFSGYASGATSTPITPTTADFPDPVAQVDFAIPESPASSILGSSAAVTRPTSPRDVSAGISSLFGEGGKLQPGVSLAFAPYRLLVGRISSKDYSDNDTTKFLARSQLSVASTAVNETALKGTRLAVGGSFILYDEADPRNDPEITRIFGASFKTVSLPSDPTLSNDGVVSRPIDATNYEAALEKYRLSKWNARSLGVGLAWRGFSDTNNINNLRDEGFGVWMTFANPGIPGITKSHSGLGSGILADGLTLISIQYRVRETVEKDSKAVDRDSARIGFQYRVGRPNFNGYVEAFWREERYDVSKYNADKFSWELGAEYKFAASTWLHVAWVDDADAKGNSGIKTGLRFAFGSGPKWAMNP